MTTFLRLLAESDKAAALREVCGNVRETDGEQNDPRLFEVAPEAFDAVPGKPFAYWVSEAVRETFRRLPAFEGEGRVARRGVNSNDDYRFIRTLWEVQDNSIRWRKHPKGGGRIARTTQMFIW